MAGPQQTVFAHTAEAVNIEMVELPCDLPRRAVISYRVGGREIGRYLGGLDEYSVVRRGQNFGRPRQIGIAARVGDFDLQGTLFALVLPEADAWHGDIDPLSEEARVLDSLQAGLSPIFTPRSVFLGNTSCSFAYEPDRCGLATASRHLTQVVFGQRRHTAEESAMARLLG
jgi:hypothetical protein